MKPISKRKFIFRGLGILSSTILTAWLFRRKLVEKFLFSTDFDAGIAVSYAPTMDSDLCVLTSKQLEGPFYFPSLFRSDIKEDRIGKDLNLKLQVLRHPDCIPIEKAMIEIWQSDAEGNYSGYPEEIGHDAWRLFMFFGKHGEKKENGEYTVRPTTHTTYLRGMQRTDSNGWVTFNTIFPCWYTGRVPHIHFKVFIDEKEQLTSQFYFEKELHDQIFSTVEPYLKKGMCPLTLQNDGALTLNPEKQTGLLLKASWNESAPMEAIARIGVLQS